MSHNQRVHRPEETAWIFILWLWLSAACLSTWWSNADYGHGFFIPLLAAFFLYQRWQLLPDPPLRQYSNLIPSLLPWLILPPIFFLELVRLAPTPWRLPIWLIYALAAASSFGTAFRLAGFAGLKAVSFPIIFMSLCVPWPAALEVPLSQTLGTWIAWCTGEILHLAGFACQVRGRIIEIEGGTLGVEDACSGIRSLHTGLAFALAVGAWHWLPFRKHLALIVIAITGAVVLNIGRSTFLAAGISLQGPSFLQLWHDAAAGTALVILCATLFAVSFRWRTPVPSLESKPVIPPKPNSPLGMRLKKTAGPLTLATLTVLLLAQLWYVSAPPSTPDHLRESDFREGTSFMPVPPPSSEILQADRAVFLRPASPQHSHLLGYHLLWLSDNGFSLSHRPEVCLPGGGWTTSGPPSSFDTIIQGRPARALGYVFERGSQRINLYWMAWIEERPATPSLASGYSLQHQLLPQLILNRRREATIEVLAIADFQGKPTCSLPEFLRLLDIYGLTP